MECPAGSKIAIQLVRYGREAPSEQVAHRDHDDGGQDDDGQNYRGHDDGGHNNRDHDDGGQNYHDHDDGGQNYRDVLMTDRVGLKRQS